MKLHVSALLAPLFASATLAAEEGGGGVFTGTLAQSIAAVIVFLVLFAILYRAAWGPILKGLQDREGKIRADLEAAQKAAADAQRTLADYKAQLAKAQEEAARIIESGKRTAEQLSAKIQDEARAEIEALRKRTAGEIQFAKESALAEIYAQAANLSADLAGQILQREIKPEDHRELIERVMEKVKA